MNMSRARAWALWPAFAAALILGGCRDVGPTILDEDSPGAAMQAPAVIHRHADMMTAVSRRVHLMQTLAKPESGTRYSLVAPAAGEPVPIPGGLFDGAFHVWAPGPPEIGLQGTHIEPNTITNFSGFVAIAFMLGTLTGSDGNTYDQFHDMRVMRGTYVDSEGRHQNGTFVFI